MLQAMSQVLQNPKLNSWDSELLRAWHREPVNTKVLGRSGQ